MYRRYSDSAGFPSIVLKLTALDMVVFCPGVPRIFSEGADAEVPDFTTVPYIDKNYINPILSYLKQSRINVNIRQVH